MVSGSRWRLTEHAGARAGAEGARQVVEADDKIYAFLTAAGSRPHGADALHGELTSRVIAHRRFGRHRMNQLMDGEIARRRGRHRGPGNVADQHTPAVR